MAESRYIGTSELMWCEYSYVSQRYKKCSAQMAELVDAADSKSAF